MENTSIFVIVRVVFQSGYLQAETVLNLRFCCKKFREILPVPSHTLQVLVAPVSKITASSRRSCTFPSSPRKFECGLLARVNHLVGSVKMNNSMLSSVDDRDKAQIFDGSNLLSKIYNPKTTFFLLPEFDSKFETPVIIRVFHFSDTVDVLVIPTPKKSLGYMEMSSLTGLDDECLRPGNNAR
jgi:hypothetical protein